MKPRLLVVVALCLLPFTPVTAQDAADLPSGVVLALNVLSETHARTATGLVISDRGQVLLPASFVGRGDDIRILVDGTRLESDALDTRTEARSATNGLAVLGTSGLERTPFALATEHPANGARLTFYAFPAAGSLAEGAAPLHPVVRVAYREGRPGFDPQSAVPTVNGALVDRCGLLAGFVFAPDDTMRPEGADRVMWSAEVNKALQAFGVNTERRSCDGSGARATPAAQDPVPEGNISSAQVLDPGSLLPSKPDLDVSGTHVSLPQAPAESNSARPLTPDTGDTTAVDRTELSEPETGHGTGTTQPTGTFDSESGQSRTSWPWLLVPLFAAAGWWLGRARSMRDETGYSGSSGTRIASDTPRYSTPAATSAAGHALVISFRVEVPGAEPRLLECPLDRAQGRLLIGRGDVDLDIGDGAGSQVHGVVRAVDDLLLYGDAGSAGGSWVDGIACLPGERFALADGTVLALGPVRLTLTNVRMEGETL